MKTLKGFIRLIIIISVALFSFLIAANCILLNNNMDEKSKPYRVEAQRITHKIENGEDFNPDDYDYIFNVEKLSDDLTESSDDYLIRKINGVCYRFDYRVPSDNGNSVLLFNIIFSAAALLIFGVLLYVYFSIIRPFETLSNYPAELAKGNLTIPLKEQKNNYFGRFIWGLDLLREHLEKKKASELELQRQNKTIVLSLSHDIKTPLGVIELYAKALQKGLYKDEDKKKKIAVSIHDKCEEIRNYVDHISNTAADEFFDIDVSDSDFYLSDLINTIRSFYSEKMRLLRTDFIINDFSDCFLCGDIDRSVEVMQNIIENAVKYGDGKSIIISFSREEDCQLIHISNSGCSLSDSELPHIFDSFWRGSNVDSQSGSGLGLYICRTIMNKMNGGIFAEICDNNMIVSVVFPMR